MDQSSQALIHLTKDEEALVQLHQMIVGDARYFSDAAIRLTSCSASSAVSVGSLNASSSLLQDLPKSQSMTIPCVPGSVLS